MAMDASFDNSDLEFAFWWNRHGRWLLLSVCPQENLYLVYINLQIGGKVALANDGETWVESSGEYLIDSLLLEDIGNWIEYKYC